MSILSGTSGAVVSILAILGAVAATVLAFIFIVPDKKANKGKKFVSLLNSIVNFKFLIIEKILQAFYIFSTAFIILLGFFMLFVITPGGYYSRSEWLGGYGILIMILGPIAIRILYEIFMMFILLVKNVISINNKLKKQDGEDVDQFSIPSFKSDDKPAEKAEPVISDVPFATPAPVEPAAPIARFCPNCGSYLDENGRCPNNCQ